MLKHEEREEGRRRREEGGWEGGILTHFIETRFILEPGYGH
jgi:hypothetical protein